MVSRIWFLSPLRRQSPRSYRSSSLDSLRDQVTSYAEIERQLCMPSMRNAVEAVVRLTYPRQMKRCPRRRFTIAGGIQTGETNDASLHHRSRRSVRLGRNADLSQSGPGSRREVWWAVSRARTSEKMMAIAMGWTPPHLNGIEVPD
jgi:hypothetical protein